MVYQRCCPGVRQGSKFQLNCKSFVDCWIWKWQTWQQQRHCRLTMSFAAKQAHICSNFFNPFGHLLELRDLKSRLDGVHVWGRQCVWCTSPHTRTVPFQHPHFPNHKMWEISTCKYTKSPSEQCLFWAVLRAVPISLVIPLGCLHENVNHHLKQKPDCFPAMRPLFRTITQWHLVGAAQMMWQFHSFRAVLHNTVNQFFAVSCY